MDDQKDVFDIRYIKLHFTIEYMEDSVVPVYKASGLRGGMGEMLLRANCVRDRNCEACDFESECIVRRTMYSKMEIQPAFMSRGDSVGYVIECEDYRDYMNAGDQTEFVLILFGKTICYFSQFLNAFYALGMNGLGKEQARFRIVSVTNSKRDPIMHGNDINMSRYEILKVSDYIRYRWKQLGEQSVTNRIKLQSPLAIKYRKEELTEFRIEAIIEAACRRIYMLDCFEGIESYLMDREYINSLPVPEVNSENHRESRIRRYSTRKENAMYLKGIEGEIELENIPDELMDILIAGELVHIGKNTSFGFGRYRINS